MTLDDVINAINTNSQLLIVAVYLLVYALGFIAGNQR